MPPSPTPQTNSSTPLTLEGQLRQEGTLVAQPSLRSQRPKVRDLLCFLVVRNLIIRLLLRLPTIMHHLVMQSRNIQSFVTGQITFLLMTPVLAQTADVVPPVPLFPNPLPPPIPPAVGMTIPTPMSSSVPSPSPYGMMSPLSVHASLFSSPTSLSSAPSFKFSLRFDRQSYHNPRSVTDCEIENGV